MAPLGLQSLPGIEGLDVAGPQVADAIWRSRGAIVITLDKAKGGKGFVKFSLWCMVGAGYIELAARLDAGDLR